MTAPVRATSGGASPAGPAGGDGVRIDPGRVRAFTTLGAGIGVDLDQRRRSVEALHQAVAAGCGHRAGVGGGLAQLAGFLGRLAAHDSALDRFLAQVTGADGPGALADLAGLAGSGATAAGLAGPGAPSAALAGGDAAGGGPLAGRWGGAGVLAVQLGSGPAGHPTAVGDPAGVGLQAGAALTRPRSPWLDPHTDSWVVGLTRAFVAGVPPSPELVARIRRDGPEVVAALARAGWELGEINQARLLLTDPERLARNWGRTGLSALHALGGLAGLGVGGAGVLVPGFDDLAERITGRRPGRELGLQAVQAAHLLVDDPDTLAEAQLGWPLLKADPYRWLGQQAPYLLAEMGVFDAALSAVSALSRSSRPIVTLSEAAVPEAALAERTLAEANLAHPVIEPRSAEPVPLIEPRLLTAGTDPAPTPPPAWPLPDLAEQRLGEPEWGQAGPVLSHRAGPYEPPEGWVHEINDPGNVSHVRSVNCVDCARAVEANWRGYDAVAAPMAESWAVNGTDRARLEQWSRGALVDCSIDQVGGMLEHLGPGSSAMVVVDWVGGDGHAFNAVNDQGVIRWVDGQSGQVDAWPPRYGKPIEWTQAIFMEPDGRPVLRG